MVDKEDHDVVTVLNPLTAPERLYTATTDSVITSTSNDLISVVYLKTCISADM